jgi:hypothetical protein
VIPSLLEASVVKAVVLSGVGGLRVFFFAVISVTVPGVFVFETAASASAFFQNLSVVCSAWKLPSGWAKVAVTSQKGSGTWERRSSSRWTIKPRVGLCTRPTERKFEPNRRVAIETARVRVAPQIRSMSWRAAPAFASGIDSESRLSKARSISSLVRAE